MTQSSSKDNYKVMAPYNFIDLNKNVLISDNSENCYNIYHDNFNSGYLDVEFTAISDLFTRGKNENFKSINNKPVFVGSSIRGPIRVLAEQMGYAEMDIVEEDFKGNSIKKYRHQVIKKNEKDFIGTIFGNEDVKNNSKVFFEDFYLKEKSEIKVEEKLPLVLSGPKASYFPHYLKQNNAPAKNWNDETVIRGFKNYWHRTEPNIWERKEFKVGKAFSANNKEFKANIAAFKKHEYIHLIVEFRINDSSDAFSMINYCSDEQIEYKKPCTKKRNYTTFYLQLKNENHFNKVKNIDKIKYTLFYVNPPMYVIKQMKRFQFQMDKTNKANSVDTKPIKIIPRGSKFKGRIRFDNLSDNELGLLLLAIELPPNHAHKIGMGKPLGLGSARFSCDLILFNRKERYSSLFDNKGNWNKANKAETEEKKEELKKAFKNHYSEEMETLWENEERIKNLFIMLKTLNKFESNWSEKTRYLELDGRNGNEFDNKNILPKPDKI